MYSKRLVLYLWVAALLVSLCLTGANLYLGDLNQDEGWYLYAARLVSEGQAPYLDFAYTQGPVLPYIYSMAMVLIDEFGVVGGRIFTALLGFIAAIGAAILAGRVAPRGVRSCASLLAFVLVGVNVYQSYFFVVVKTYALCAALLVAGFVLLSLAGRRQGWIYSFLAGVFIALAAGTRISVGVVLPVMCFFLAYQAVSNRPGSGFSRMSWLWFGLGGALTSALVFLPFLLMARDSFVFNLIGYHAGRDAGTPLKQLVYKAGFISRVVQSYFVPVMSALAVILWRLLVRKDLGKGEVPQERPPILNAIWLSVAAVTLVHISAPFPYDDYQVTILPLFAAAAACELALIPRSPRVMSWAMCLVFCMALGSSCSSMVNQDWMIKERDRIWWHIKEKSSLLKLVDQGKLLKELAGDDRRLLTQDIYLAVEAGLKVPYGLELGPFSYYPEMDDETARRRHVVNRKLLKDILMKYDAPVAAFSGYGLSIRCPQVSELTDTEQSELWQLVDDRYKLHNEIEHFGQALTTLRVLVPKQDGD